jgi:hypothetical protein
VDILAEIEEMLGKKPLKSKKLKIIDHLGTYYATFDGSTNWKVEKWLYKLLRLCNGKVTVDQIATHLAKVADVSVEQIRPSLKEILDELERERFISYI